MPIIKTQKTEERRNFREKECSERMKREINNGKQKEEKETPITNNQI